MTNKILAAGFVALGLLFGINAASAANVKTFLAAVDTDHDGTVTLDEVKTYAAARFKALETDKDGTLDAKELKGRLSATGFKKANADADKTIDENEFVAYVEKLFKEANDGDDTLDAKELRSPAGRKLVKLLQ
jgi:Ca2+-binding EF-hand superfamily protein